MSPHIPKKLEKFNNFVSNSFKVKDDVVCVGFGHYSSINLLISLLLLDQETPMGVCSEKQTGEIKINLKTKIFEFSIIIYSPCSLTLILLQNPLFFG